MGKIAKNIYHIIKRNEFADPFNELFDYDRLSKEFGTNLNEEETNILHFLKFCNKLATEIFKNIVTIFENLNLPGENIRELFFIFTNKYFLDYTPLIIRQIQEGSVFELEKTIFTKIKKEAKEEINAQSAVELGGDILALLIKFSFKWIPTHNSRKNYRDNKIEDYKEAVTQLWNYTNIYLNLRDSAYHLIKHEEGTIVFREENEIKINTKLNKVAFLTKAGIIRGNNNISEYFFTFSNLYEKAFSERKGVVNFTIQKNILHPIIGKSNSDLKTRAHASLLLFYPHLADIKLTYFDNLTLIDILDMFILIEESIELLNKKNIEEYTEKSYEDIPIKFNESELSNFLIKATGNKRETVDKFLSSIKANPKNPYFWREPLLQIGDSLYFSLAAIISPNHVLFFDKWTRMAGISYEEKENRFTEIVRKELSDSKQIPFHLDLIDLSKFKVDTTKFKNNILLETASLLILLEIKIFDYPLEPSETERELTRLAIGTSKLEEKSKKILCQLNGQKTLVKIIITNYTCFSGLQLNSIPIADLTLFKNYLFNGKIERVAISFQDKKPHQSNSVVLHYYRNEDEFNANLKHFFTHPIPVYNILDRLYLKEILITPNFLIPKIYIDIVDHVSDEQLIENRINNLAGLLNYEYFSDPTEKSIKDALSQTIIFSLTEIFSQLSYASYESYSDRIDLYHKVSKTKMVGFVHLTFYILKAIEKLNGKKVKKNHKFEKIEYNTEEAFSYIDRIKYFKSDPQKIRLTEFKVEEGTFTAKEEKEIISLAIDALSGISLKTWGPDILDSAIFSLALLHGFTDRYDIEYEFYNACSNIIDGLNYCHKYQSARDFAEEILMLSVNNKKHSQGWNILFKCYTAQKSNFDASINGCLFLSSLTVMPEVSNYLIVEALYGALKFFRNFGFSELSKHVYENVQNIDLSEYDKQKLTLSYFNNFLQGEILQNRKVLDDVIEYLESNIDNIIKYGEHGIIPWLGYLYNIERLKKAYKLAVNKDIKKYLDKFEGSIDPESAKSLHIKILGSAENQKEAFISAIMNTFQTRSVRDFVHDAQHLNIMASFLLPVSISQNDIDGILLTGLVINDQSLSFVETNLKFGAVVPVSVPENFELKNRLNNYKYYLLANLNLSSKQCLIWLFENMGKIFCLILDSNKEFNLYPIPNWELSKSNRLLRRIGSFSFNAKKDHNGNAKCQFSNPKGEHDYNDLIQKEDYENLLKELSFTKLPIELKAEEILIYSSIEMANFPHNLIEVQNDFVAAKKSICNVITIERFIENHQRVNLEMGYSISSWIPTDDQEPTISWGFDILNPILTYINAKTYTTTYPSEPIATDLNIFLAHGVTDRSGFKAVYSNHADKKGIVYPYSVFGTGKVAILFICNSGSSHNSIYSNSVVSFTSELLKSGYEAVIAPFWSFDVTMSGIWLREFLNNFNLGNSINRSVFLANKKLTEYDESTSSFFKAPAGCLAMHLYGNPNVFVEEQL